MRWVQSEYALKGLFLALLFYTALQIQILPTLPAGEVRSADDEMRLAWQKTGSLALYMLGGLAVGIILGLLRQIKDLSRIFVKPHAFLLFLLLENPLLIYLGLIGGLGLGAFHEFDPQVEGRPNLTLMACFGMLVGVGFGRLREIEDFRRRMGLIVIVGVIVVYFLHLYLEQFNGGKFLTDKEMRKMLGFHILLGLPFYYLLCFVGIGEESEAEIAGLCTMLGFAIHLLQFPSERMQGAGFLLPVTIYFVYSMYVLPDLRVFKHTLRGYIYMQVGKLRAAILSFRRALQLDPKNQLAQQGMDTLHANIEIEKVDAATLGLLDPNRCLKRVRLLLGKKPTADQLKKAHHILDLVEKLWPKLTSHVIYYRAVAAVHAGEIDKACESLNDLLNPEGWFTDDVARKTILFDAWQLVLLVHPVLKQRVGEPQLALPGRRMEAIAAVERQMAIQPNDPTIQEFRKSLYEDLPEDEYFAIAQQNPPADFAHRFVEEIGARLIPNFELWKRGAQFLRMAAHGQPLRRPVIYQKLAEAFAKAGETLEATGYLQKLRDSGLEVGLTTLPDDQRSIYFGTVRRLADEAAARGDIDEAIYNYSLATHAPDSGVPTLKALAEQYQKKQDIMNALRITEKALCHDGRDEDLLAKKDSYYYSLSVEDLATRAKDDDNVRKYFDVNYCVKKAKSILDSKTDSIDNIDWATHLLSLALVMQPKNMIAAVQKARLHLRKGERTEGLTLFEDVKEMKPATSEETDAWYFVHKQLGKLYLDELNRADLSIPVFLEYLNHMGSGAETHYDLGRAYEAVGDKLNAIKHYQMVTAYESHPLRWDAESAIRRLKGN